MRTVRTAIDDILLDHLDRAARKANKTRSELIRSALQEWTDGRAGSTRTDASLIASDRAGYEAHPVRPDEFEGLIAAQTVEMHGPTEGV